MWPNPPLPSLLDQNRWDVATYTSSCARQLSDTAARDTQCLLRKPKLAAASSGTPKVA
jgi:hypothetical protein